MSLREDLNIAGRLTIEVRSADGALVEERRARNEITIHGRELVARLFNRDKADDDIPRISRIGVGGDDRKFDPQDNALVKPVGYTDITSIDEVTVTDGARPRKMLRLTGELGERDCNGELREAGLFTAGDGVMYNRVTFAPINKSPEFKLTLVWEITF